MGKKLAKKKNLSNQRKVVVRNEDGEPVEIPLGSVVDYAEPIKDDKLGVVPEFVNISSKIQLLCVPHNTDGTLIVSKYGIVRGTQWRMFSLPNKKVWGDFPPFIERELLKNNKYDEKYLLSEEQMLEELDRLVRIKAIRELLKSAVITQPEFQDDVGPNGMMVIYRENESRSVINDFALRKIMDLEDEARKKREDAGIFEESNL